jgi:hypothetical protein
MKIFRRILLVSLVGVLASINLYAQSGVLLKNSNLRKAPMLDASIIKVIPKGTKVFLKEKHGEWVKVQNGYIFAALVGDKLPEEKVVQEVVVKPKKTEKEVVLVHQFTRVIESGDYLLDAKFIRFEKCDKFGWCKLKGEDSYVKEYLYLKKDDGRYMKRGPDLAYIYKRVQMPISYDPNEKVVNVKDFKGEERTKLNKKKNTKFGYVKLKDLMPTTKEENKVAKQEKKEPIKEVVLEETKPEVKEEVIVKKEPIKQVVQKVEEKPAPKKELSADEKRLLELQKLIEQYDKQLADLEKDK